MHDIMIASTKIFKDDFFLSLQYNYLLKILKLIVIFIYFL